MLKDYQKLIKHVKKNQVPGRESRAYSEDRRMVPSCCITTPKLSRTELIDKPLFAKDSWKKFWGICKENFPLHSVHGGASNIKQIEDCERNQSAMLNFLDMPCTTMQNLLNGGRVFEIGYGYGYFGKQIMRKKTWNADYYGIDYIASDKSLLKYKKNGRKRFYEIDKSGIPEKFLSQKFDMIYSVNVMQHLTKTQRQEYFSQAARMMTTESVLYFDVFEWNKEKGDTPRDGYATVFFGAKTHIETPEEMENMLDKAGLRIFDRKIKPGCCDETNSVKYICVLK